MVKRCCHGTCNSDSRYPERLENGVVFVPFPKPKSNLDKCRRWIRSCGRPRDQLNVENINKNRYVCSKHFHDQQGPTKEFPDPIPADPYTPQPKPCRPSPKRRRLFASPHIPQENVTSASGNTQIDEENKENCNGIVDTATQTSNLWVEPLDFFTLTVENAKLKQEIAEATLERIEVERKIADFKKTKPKRDITSTKSFTIIDIQDNKELIKHYTGFSKEAFLSIFKLLVPNEKDCPFEYTGKGKLKQISSLCLKDQLLLTLCKLRLNLDHLDLGHRFEISKQTVSVIFNSWINYMFLRFGEIPTWPPRQTIIDQMPVDFRKEFYTTIAMLDCTELKTEKPSSLKTQSQTYSDYKSSNTLKGLVAVDPRGSVMFTSMLFSGSISDKELFTRSGLKDQLKCLIDIKYLQMGDALMGDKGFNIKEDVEEVGLSLNIPPFAASGSQMSTADVEYTRKIAKHRVHVERAIRRIKTFRILSDKIPVTMIASINQIWFTCAFLTNFMPLCIKKK